MTLYNTIKYLNHNINNNTRTTTYESQRFNISCIMFKSIAFFIIKLLDRLYVMVGIFYLHDHIISIRVECIAHTTSFILRCVCQARTIGIDVTSVYCLSFLHWKYYDNMVFCWIFYNRFHQSHISARLKQGFWYSLNCDLIDRFEQSHTPSFFQGLSRL